MAGITAALSWGGIMAPASLGLGGGLLRRGDSDQVGTGSPCKEEYLICNQNLIIMFLVLQYIIRSKFKPESPMVHVMKSSRPPI